MFCFLSYTHLSSALTSHFLQKFCLPRVWYFSWKGIDDLREQPLSCLPPDVGAAGCLECWSWPALRPQTRSEMKNFSEEEPTGFGQRDSRKKTETMGLVLFKFLGAPGHIRTHCSGHCFSLLPFPTGVPEERDQERSSHHLGTERPHPHSPYTNLSSIRTVVPSPPPPSTLCQTWSSLASHHYYGADTFHTLVLLDCLLYVLQVQPVTETT